jgi:hypothetical protein
MHYPEDIYVFYILCDAVLCIDFLIIVSITGILEIEMKFSLLLLHYWSEKAYICKLDLAKY